MTAEEAFDLRIARVLKESAPQNFAKEDSDSRRGRFKSVVSSQLRVPSKASVFTIRDLRMTVYEFQNQPPVFSCQLPASSFGLALKAYRLLLIAYC